MRSILIGLALLAVGAAQAFAQVAAPSLLPGTARVFDPEQYSDLFTSQFDQGTTTDVTFVPENPAAQQWAHAALRLAAAAKTRASPV